MTEEDQNNWGEKMDKRIYLSFVHFKRTGRDYLFCN